MTAKHIAILAYGTRGDIEPMIALGLALRNAGFRVRLAVPRAFEQLVLKEGIAAAPIRAGMDRMLASRRLWKYYRFGLLSRWLYIHDIQKSIGAKALEDMWSACRGCDAIVFHPMLPFATDIAEAMAVPCIMAAFQPLTPTRRFPLFSVAAGGAGGALNLLSYKMATVPYVYFTPRINAARRRLLGLGKRGLFADPLTVRGDRPPAVYGISKAVVSQPDDWPASALISGYWSSKPGLDTEAPSELDGFLAASRKPVYIGFGSNPIASANDLLTLLTGALKAADLRAVVCLSAAQLQSVSIAVDHARMFLSGPLPHHWLFERVAAAVHHGGAGTVAASLRAGLPTLVCPLLIDQLWWAGRVHALGAGPSPIRYDKLTVSNLTASLRDLTSNPRYAANAATIAEIISTENGAARAADFIAQIANGGVSRVAMNSRLLGGGPPGHAETDAVG